MANPFYNALATAGAILGTPGAVVRAAISPRVTMAEVANPLDAKAVARRVSGRGLLREFGLVGDQNTWGNFTAGLGAEIALDPVTWLMPAVLKYLGRAASRVGPRFAGGIEKIEHAAGVPSAAKAGTVGTRAHNFARQIDAIKGLPPSDLRQVLAEIPPGSEFLGAGRYATALKTPYGDVVRVESLLPGEIGRLPPRPNLPILLQPTRSVGAESGLARARVERLPFVPPIEGSSESISPAVHNAIQEALEPAKYVSRDLTTSNVAMRGGQPVVIDPGSVMPRPFLKDLPQLPPDLGVVPTGSVPPGLSALLRAMGYTKRVQAQAGGIPKRVLAALLAYEAAAREAA